MEKGYLIVEKMYCFVLNSKMVANITCTVTGSADDKLVSFYGKFSQDFEITTLFVSKLRCHWDHLT